MKNDLIALMISYGYVFLILVISAVVSKVLKGPSEVSRKIVHIMVGNWIFLSPLFASLWAILLVPFSFIIMNFLSMKFNLFKSIERGNPSYGTVYYAISLTVLVGIAFSLNWPLLSYAGVLMMAYGDGFAAIIGKKFGKRYPFSFSPKKSLEGTVAVFVFSAMIAFACLVYFDDRLLLLGKVLLALATGFVASFIELAGKAGCDNLTLPLGAGLFLTLSTYFGDGYYYLYLAVVVFILIVSIKRESLTYEGVIAAFLTAITLYTLGNPYLGYALLVFFVAGSLATQMKNKEKMAIKRHTDSSVKRTWIQVLTNSLPASLLVWLYLYHPTRDLYLLLAFAVFSAAAADTFASELGSLTKARVFSVLNFKEVPKGLSGGISIPGLLASMVGAMLLSLFTFPNFGLKGFLITSLLGFLGSIIDSYLGILFQRKYKNGAGVLQDKYSFKGQRPDAGLAFVSNNTVNLVTLFLVSLLGYVILI